MNYHTDIALRKTVADYCKVRGETIANYRMALKMHATIGADVRAIGLFGAPSESEPRCSLEDFIKDLDRSLWRLVFKATGLPRYMDDEARKDFERGLEKDPPPFEEDSIRSTLVSSAAKADEMFARGLYNLFRTRSDAHRTNTRERFKIPNKIIWTGMIDVAMTRIMGKLSLSHYQRDRLNDLDRVFRTLAGEPYQPYALEGRLLTVFRAGADTFEDEVLKVRGFKNGSLHVCIKRQDLLDRANRIIADYAGAVIPDARSA